jgi:hypothetical protein
MMHMLLVHVLCRLALMKASVPRSMSSAQQQQRRFTAHRRAIERAPAHVVGIHVGRRKAASVLVDNQLNSPLAALEDSASVQLNAAQVCSGIAEWSVG